MCNPLSSFEHLTLLTWAGLATTFSVRHSAGNPGLSLWGAAVCCSRKTNVQTLKHGRRCSFTEQVGRWLPPSGGSSWERVLCVLRPGPRDLSLDPVAGGEEHGEGTATSHILDQVLAGLAGPRLWGEDAAVTATCREVVGGALGSGRKRGHSLEGPREQV